MPNHFHNDELRQLHQQGDFIRVVELCQNYLMELRDAAHSNKSAEAEILEDLSRAQAAMLDYPAAIQSMLKRLEIDISLAGETSSDCIIDLRNLGVFYFRSGQLAEAESVLLQALHLLSQVPETEQWQRAWVLIGIARVHATRTDYYQAERFLLQAAKQRLLDYGWHRPEFAAVYNLLAQLYRKMGRPLAAERALRKAMRIHDSAAETKSLEGADGL